MVCVFAVLGEKERERGKAEGKMGEGTKKMGIATERREDSKME